MCCRGCCYCCCDAKGEIGSDADSTTSEGGLLPTLTKSHRGLFAGVIVLAGGFIAVMMFFLDAEGNTADEAVVYLATDCSLHSLMLVATVIALVKMHQV
jgi:hypothetical protein